MVSETFLGAPPLVAHQFAAIVLMSWSERHCHALLQPCHVAGMNLASAAFPPSRSALGKPVCASIRHIITPYVTSLLVMYQNVITCAGHAAQPRVPHH
jgi:hypothetical protein